MARPLNVSTAVRLALLACSPLMARAANLPVPCVAGTCGAGAPSFVGSGQATAVQSGSHLTVNQASSTAVLNWQSFNIANGSAVQFVQPNTAAVALNQIFDSNPSQIFGALTANGRVFLINQNGIVFGGSAQVNVGGLLASSLNINPLAITNGLIAPGSAGQAAFQAFSSGPSGTVSISNGATLQTAQGGEILIFAPQISNQGSISTPGGQTMLAAGNTIYLASSSDPNLRGLLVEVGDTGGTVTNGTAANASAASQDQLIGQIMAKDGNITLAGLAVNQLGRVSATTSINENGSIRLQAADHGSIVQSGANGVSGQLQDGTGGQLVLGSRSATTVTLDSTDTAVTVDSVPQLKSAISMSGDSIQMLSDSLAQATSGTINVTAQLAPHEAPSTFDGSRFYMAPGAELDVSGASVVLPVSSNVIAVQLRGSELADSPLQQNGPLRGQTVYVDIRQEGPLVNGVPSWQGTPLADVSGEIAAIGHNVLERNLAGGTVNIQSNGDAILAAGSTVNVAGGQIQYTSGYVNTTNLINTNGQIVNIAAASPNVLYTGIANTATASDPKWGTSTTYNVTQGVYTPGYVEGKDAGTLQVSAPSFVLDGSANTSTVAGIFQRLPDQPLLSGQLYRDPSQLPKAATLIIGTPGSDAGVQNVTVSSGLVLPGLTNADGSAFDPLTDPLPATFTTSTLRPELLGGREFGNVSIYTNGSFLEPAGVALTLPAGGSFLVSADLIYIEGGITVPGGVISAVAQPTVREPTAPPQFQLTVGPTAVLSTAGAWVNDNPLLYPSGNTAPLVLNGGSISLLATANDTFSPGVRVDAGSLIDVSGGGQLTTAGHLNAGTGGSIAIGASPLGGTVAGLPGELQLAGTLRGYGLTQGGSLSLTSGSICIAAADCAGGDPDTYWVSPANLASGGFSAYTLSAVQGGLNVAPGTILQLQQQNYVLPANISRIADQSSLNGIATTQLLADQLRKPVNLTLNQSVLANQDNGVAPIVIVDSTTPLLTIGQGALLLGDPGAQFSFSSNVKIDIDGTLRAPGGSIAMTLASGLAESTYNPTQGIWLEGQGILDVSGAAQIFPNALGQPTGTVLNGGTVSLTAQRGFVELQPGSLINVSGASGTIDVAGVGATAPQAEQVASAGGTVALAAAEGVGLSGTLEAAAGTAGAGQRQPAGGIFSLTLDGSARADYALSGGQPDVVPFPNIPRQIIVSTTQPETAIASGTGVPDALAGNAYVSTSALQTAGFDTISLKAAPMQVADPTTGQVRTLAGSILFQGNSTLSANQLITLDAASYAVSPGAVAQVLAPYIEFGNSDQFNNGVPTATGGTGTLNVQGNFVELYGASSLQGIGNAHFSSAGDLRLRGLLDLSVSGSTNISGSLSAAGNIELTAQQIYPTTLSQFLVSADPGSVNDPQTGSILITGVSGNAASVLSAGGALTLSAGTITQSGVLRAPFGTLDLIAPSIQLSPGSVTSTSADGQTVPFGTTQGGLDWVYPLTSSTSIVYGNDGIAPPAQHVTLQGAQVDVQSGATVDVSGGGDLQAYEWIPGTGGTNDVLSQSFRPGQYAIVPGLSLSVTPYDPAISKGSTLQLGQSVYLAASPGLAAGTYQLLPARYALLPGAFLVSQVSGYQDIQVGQSYAVAGGGTIVAGYNSIAGTPFADSRTSGFNVVPASVVLQQAQYTTTGANSFFAAQAAAADVPAPRLPQDSGVLALIASNALTLNGTLRTASAGGLGAEVDISSADIVVGTAATPVNPGQILVTAASLDALGAQTLLLGGLRSGDAIDTTAQTVDIADGAMLSAPLVLLAAQDLVSVDNGATIAATAGAPLARSYTLTGDGALLSVSSGPQNSITRTNASGVTGTLTLASGSTLQAPAGSVYLEASNTVNTQGTLSLGGADLAVQSPGIILGAPPANMSGTVLGSNILGAESLRSLLLASGSDIDVFGSVGVNAQNISIDAPGLSGFGTASDVATLTATNSISLGNSQSSPTTDVGAGSGTLNIIAPRISASGGTLALSGFGATSLNAQQALTATATGGLNTTGTLTVTAAAVTSSSDADLALTATGAVALLAPSQTSASSGTSSLGGSLAVTGSSVSVDIPINLPSGRVSLTATQGDITLQSGGSLNVAGVVQTYDNVAVATPGGVVSLASAGNIDLAPGSRIDVSAGSGGNAGALSLSAPSGNISLGGALAGTGAPGSGGSAIIDAQSFGDFGALTQALAGGGFTGTQAVRLRGPGDLLLSAGNSITAANVSLEADQGSVEIDGSINAASGQGGAVTLAATNDVIVNGAIDAHATGVGETGGTVNLETTGGRVLLNSGSTLNVSGDGATGGTVLLRVPGATVTALASGGSGVALDGTIVGSSKTTLEGFAVYDNQTGTISATDVAANLSNPIYADAVAFMSNADAITAALGQSTNSAFVLAPGVEIDATTVSNGTGNLELDTPWNLYGWRFGDSNNVPGILTLRAQNGITFNASLSDGFTATRGTGAFTLPTQASDSWSYRIAAGADFDSANPLTTGTVSDPSNPANVTIAACSSAVTCKTGTQYTPVMVRTGNGFIDVSAAGDFVLASQASLLYTAGVAGPGVPLGASRVGTLQSRSYPTDGGDIQIDVAGNILGTASSQFVNAWLWRVGAPNSQPTGSPTAWTVDFQSFQQGVGALAGGNVSVSAGGDISNFSVSIPTIGVPLGGTTQATSTLQIEGGGNLNVTAGGSILAGSYFVGAGSSTLKAGANIGAVPDPNGDGSGLSPVIGLGDATFAATARGDLQLSEILNPFLLNKGQAQGAGSAVYFSTYGANSAATLTSVGGDVVLNDDNANFTAQVGASFLGSHVTNGSDTESTLDTLPPTLDLLALNGNVDIGRTLVLTPSGTGNLQVFANQNVETTTNSAGLSGQLILSDADPTQLPTTAAPQVSLQIYDDIAAALTSQLPDQHAPIPVHLSEDQTGLQPVRVVALNGNVEFQPAIGGSGGGIWSAKPVQVVAGGDVLNLNLVAQNLSATDVTSVVAGRDVGFLQQRDANGSVVQAADGITVDGPGQIQVTAGRNVNLGTSDGISSRADLVNTALPAQGADISVNAGVSADNAKYGAFIDQYIQGSDQFDSELVGFLQTLTGQGGLSTSQAKQTFAALTPQLQHAFVEQLFFNILQIYGRQEAASGNGDFTGAFNAISTLFPGANPDLAAGQKNPYSGDIDLYFSRIYTQQGGNISLLAPGGLINVGLALAPASFGINKAPDQLGIVAQTSGNVDSFSYSDFEVNQSRVFAADGGNILVWATQGNIDAGRGAKTSISAPALNIAYDSNGQPAVTLRAAVAGSGIQALAASPGVLPGDVDLFAPHGVVNANDAGIVAGNLTVAATAVLGASNISVSGTTVGVPVTVTGLGASFAGAASSAGSTGNAAENAAAEARSGKSATPASDAAISFLDVFVTGLGEDSCKAEDTECLKRQKTDSN